MSNSAHRSLLGALCLVFAFAGACDKSKSSTAPAGQGGDQADGSGATAPVTLRYSKAAQKLNQSLEISVTQTGAQAKSYELAVDTGLDVSSAEGGLKVVWTAVKAPKIQVGGKDSKESRAFIEKYGRGAYLMDELGESDEEASTKLAENSEYNKKIEEAIKKAQSQGGSAEPPEWAQVMDILRQVVQFPGLPKQALAVGQPVSLEEEEEVNIGPLKIPMEKDSKYTLVKIDDAGGKRIAELKFEIESSGATELQGQMISLSMTNEGILLFNVDDGYPVSREGQSTQMVETPNGAVEVAVVNKVRWERP